MQKFRYTAYNLQKHKIKGTFIAQDEKDLGTQLARQGLYLIKAIPYTGAPSFFTFGVGKVSSAELTNFCRQFAIMQNTHIPILDCLEILKGQSYSSFFRQTLQLVYDDVKSGVVLSEALNNHPKVFPEFFRSMIKVGEVSGKIDQIFESLAVYYERDNEQRRKLWGALSYPMILLGMTFAVLLLMLLVIVPIFRKAMAEMDVTVEGITLAVYNLSDFVINYWPYMIVILLVGILGIFLVMRTERGKYYFDAIKLKIPVVNQVALSMVTARFARAFGLLLSSGMDLSEAMRAVEIVIGNRYTKHRFGMAAESVRQGMSLTAAFEAYGIFPPMMVQMISVGERTATLDEVLTRSCNYFDSKVESSLASFTSKLQPILLAFMGGVIGILFIAVYSPMLNIMNGLA